MDTDRIHEVRGSELTTFRECRVQHNWSFTEGYTPPIIPAPLEFGQAFHIGMETFWNPETWHLLNSELYILARDAFVAECERQLKQYLDRSGMYVLEAEAAADYEDRIDLGKGMLRKFIRTLDRKNFKPIAVEQEAFVPIINPETGDQVFCKCRNCWTKYSKLTQSTYRTFFELWPGLPVYYGIKIDAMLQSILDGAFWIVDWKTTGQILQDQTILELDGQVASYCWALMHIMELDIRGFQYVQVYKGYPKLPRELAVQRGGRWYSTNRQQRTDFDTYGRFVKKYDTNAFDDGLYNEYLEWLKAHGPTFVKWHKVYKTPAQLNNIGQDLSLSILDLLESHRIYASPGRMKCSWCRFQEPCLERQSGGDYQGILDDYFIKEEPYYVQARARKKGNES